jgi:cellulose synthase/poly-beta-1,6-N-acetylglucosamine synthase-like glycosyltransferase
LQRQHTDSAFTYSILVVDNDQHRSAEALVAEFDRTGAVPAAYALETRQSIALTRNKAVEHASSDLLAFIDDDEVPIERWLLILFKALQEYGVDGVLGPVAPYFDEPPPKWLVDGKFYDRETYRTGHVIDWRQGRTGNVLLKRDVLMKLAQPFRPEFRTGEDQDTFRRLIELGHVFIWCNEAVAYELVPTSRWRRSFLLRRAMLRGAIEPCQPTFGFRDIARSVGATLAYAAALPVAAALGQTRLMSLIYKLSYHLGVVLASAGVQPIKQPYVTS